MRTGVEGVLLVGIALLVAWGVSVAPDAALAEAALRTGDLVRTPEQVVFAAWRGYAMWLVGIAAMPLGRAIGRALGPGRAGAIPAGIVLIPAIAAATGLGLVLQLGYGDPLHAAGWPGERFADGVLLGGLVAGLVLALPVDLGEVLDRTQVVLVGGIVATFAALALFGSGPGGSSARITLGPIQPLELVKLAFVLFLAGYLGRRAPMLRHHRLQAWGGLLRLPRPELLLPAVGVLLVLFAGLFLVRDLGPTLVLSLVFLAVLYLVTRSPGWVGIAVGTVSTLLGIIVAHPDVVGSERVAVRLEMWLHPWLNSLPNGDQLAQSRWAIAAGGIGGLGLGGGQALPAGHTDLAIAHLAEELGFLGVIGYLAAIVAMVGAGMAIAERNRTPERALAAAGLSLLLAAQTLVILGGTTGVLPLTGIVAPFLSSGRTSTTVFVVLVALVVKLAEAGQAQADTDALSELRHTVRGVGTTLAVAMCGFLVVLFVEGVATGPSTSARGAVTTLADGTVTVLHDPRVMAIAARIPRGSLLDREGRVLAGTGEDLGRTWPLGDALGALLGPPSPEVLRPAWTLERLHDPTLRGYGELDDGPAVWMDGDQLLFAVHSRVERPADRLRAEQIGGHDVRLLPLPSPDLRGLVRLLRASDAEITRIAEDVHSRSVTLTLDAELQAKSADVLAHWSKNAKAAAAVVIDVDSGQVLARVQVPDYDPADAAWRAPVWANDPAYMGVYGPWTDKTGAMGTVQAGSIAKLLTSVAAVRTGEVTFEGEGCDVRAEPTFDCVEADRQGPLFTRDDWTKPIHDHSKDKVHGTIDLTTALAVSCNVYFGQLGLDLGPEPLAALVADGVDLGWSETFAPGAAGSRTLASTAFGQGTAAMSASQAARLVALVGAGGTYRKCPSDLRMDGTCEERALVSDPRMMTPVIAGMSAVMTRGTGRTLPAIEGVRVYGKTGTADAVGLEEEKPYGITPGDRNAPTHSWFVALAEPAEAPECGVRTSGRLAVAVLVARGGSGRAAAAPAAVDILRAAHDLGWLTPTQTASVGGREMTAVDALPSIAGHTADELIRVDDHEWVLRTRFGGRAASTRIARVALPADADGGLRASVLAGAPLDETLPWELRRILEGHRVRASLPAEWPLPTVLAAGLSDGGHPYVTRGWIDGESMGRAWPSSTTDVRDDALEQLLWLLERLHDRRVVFQDLKPDNVVLDAAGKVWLVDLESLRCAPSGAVPCTHYTPRYAAPEQLVGRSSAPSSDLYAFGKLLTELANGAPEPRWTSLGAACLALDPRLRPTAAEAVRWLHGEPPRSAEATIRVPEPVTLPNVPRDRTAENPLEPVVQALPKRGPWRTLGLMGTASTLSVALGLGLTLGTGSVRLNPPVGREQAAAELVTEVREGLREHKVVAEKNNEAELARLLVLARQASVLDPSKEALAEIALATVWSQRWHWRGARWDAAAFRISDAASKAALDAGETPEALLARGLTAAAGCRHAPAGDPRREGWCAEALGRLDDAAERGPDWLAVEARWGAVMVLNSEARRALDREDGEAAIARAELALRRCELAGPQLPSAPVNGVELVEDCVWAAGAARDQARWHAWTGWWITHQPTTLGPGGTAFLVRSAAPECARLQVDAQGIPLELEDGGWGSWCAAMTSRTLRCVDGRRGRRPAWCP